MVKLLGRMMEEEARLSNRFSLNGYSGAHGSHSVVVFTKCPGRHWVKLQMILSFAHDLHFPLRSSLQMEPSIPEQDLRKYGLGGPCSQRMLPPFRIRRKREDWLIERVFFFSAYESLNLYYFLSSWRNDRFFRIYALTRSNFAQTTCRDIYIFRGIFIWPVCLSKSNIPKRSIIRHSPNSVRF